MDEENILQRKKKIVNIVCTIDNNYAQHCGVMLYSLFEQNKELSFHIFILTEGISSLSKKRLTKITKLFEQKIDFIKIDFPEPEKYLVDGHISLATYYRLLMTNYLPSDIDKILFLDVDLVINGSIKQLWDINLENYSHAAAADLGHEDRKDDLAIPNEVAYFNAGVLLINLQKWRNKDIGGKVLTFLHSNWSNIIWHDQDALNGALWNDYKLISNKWNLLYNFFLFDKEILGISQKELDSITTNPIIIHYNTSSKPWHLENKHPFKDKYTYYLEKTAWKHYSYKLDYIKRFINLYLRKIGNKLKSFSRR